MVRQKVVLRRIEDKAKRAASFSKRRNGLLKKARELAVLCDAEVGVIVFSPMGKLSCFSSHSSIETTIQHFYEFSHAEENVKQCAVESKNCSKGWTCQDINNGMLEIAQRLSDQQSIIHLNMDELNSLEKELDKALEQTRYRKREALLQDRSRLESLPNGGEGSSETAWKNSQSAKQPHHDSDDSYIYQHRGDEDRPTGDHSGNDSPEAADISLGLRWPPHRSAPADDRVEAAPKTGNPTILFL